jgi:leader peptidase (prepilin peptidase)/N-methyltransferase
VYPTAEAGLPLFALMIGLLGAAVGLLAESGVRRVVPRLSFDTSVRLRITTAALTGALSAAMAFRFGQSWALAAYLVLVVLAVQLALMDIRHHLLPNPLVLALLMAGAVLLGAASAASPTWDSMVRAVAAGAILFVIYLILAVISPRGIGMGDVKLAAPLGLYLGYLGWSQLFYGGALGFVVGGVVTAFLVRAARGEKPAEVAFGPSMFAAALAVILLPV